MLESKQEDTTSLTMELSYFYSITKKKFYIYVQEEEEFQPVYGVPDAFFSRYAVVFIKYSIHNLS